MASRLTELNPARAVRRLVYPQPRSRAHAGLGHHPPPLVVELKPEGVYLREKGRRTGYLVPYGVAYITGARLEADRIRREKLAKRQERKALRGGR